MKLKSLTLFFTSLTLVSMSLGQTDNSVDIIPRWKKNQTNSVKIKSTTTDYNNGKQENYYSNFDAKFTVKEASENGYEIEWTYTNTKLSENESVVENQIIAKLINTKLLIRLSEIGRFVELINAEDVKLIANKAVDELINISKSNPTMNTQYKFAKQLIASKQGLEVAILKQIKFYYFSFGSGYRLNAVETNNLKIPSPLGGEPFNAIEKIELTQLDNKSSVCTVETNKIIDSKILQKSVIDYIKKITNSNPQAIGEMNKANLEMTESTMQQINFSTGLIKKSYYRRVMNLGFENRTTLLEIETLE